MGQFLKHHISVSSASEDIVESAEARIAADPSPWGPRLAILAVASALFMQSIDSTALSTALPTLARAFDTNPINLKLCLTAYIMALAVFVPASGWAADRFGARRVFMAAMAVFLLGSADRMVIGLIVEPIKATFHVSDSAIGFSTRTCLPADNAAIACSR
jgi:MFS family permease